MDKKNQEHNIIAFWRPHEPNGYLGQWYESKFEITEDICNDFPNKIKKLPFFVEQQNVLTKLSNDQQYFNTPEKFMMMAKAALFEDNETFDKMSKTDSPNEQRKLGRIVKNFNEFIWNKYNRDIVKIGNYLKFSQN